MTTIKDFYIGENDGSGIQAKSKEEFFEYLEEKIQEADAVVIGAGAGFSTSAGCSTAISNV